MNKMISRATQLLVGLCSSFVFLVAMSSVNATCIGPSYQPKVPSTLAK